MKKQLIQNLRRAKVSTTAREVMLDLLFEVSHQKPLVFVNVDALAESVGRTKATIRKAVRELVSAGFLSWDGTVVSLKHKIYKVVFDIVEQTKEIVTTATKSIKQAVRALVRPTQVDPSAKELEHALRDFGFTDSERNEVIAVNGVEKTKRLLLEYLHTLKMGKTIPVKDWFIMRYVQERQAQKST